MGKKHRSKHKGRHVRSGVNPHKQASPVPFPPEVEDLLLQAREELTCCLCKQRGAWVSGLFLPDTSAAFALLGATPEAPKILAYGICRECWSLSDQGQDLTLAVEAAVVEDTLKKWTKARRAVWS